MSAVWCIFCNWPGLLGACLDGVGVKLDGTRLKKIHIPLGREPPIGYMNATMPMRNEPRRLPLAVPLEKSLELKDALAHNQCLPCRA